MKAWKVNAKDEFYSTVVFAETRGKAKSLALNTDCCDDIDFTDIEARRFPEADKMYNGRNEMDWYNLNDRLFLVKECNWRCEYPEFEDCKKCIAKEHCSEYEYMSEEYESGATE